MPKPPAANQQTQGSPTGCIPQLWREGANPNGIFSGMTQRLKMTNGEFVPSSLTKDLNKGRKRKT